VFFLVFFHNKHNLLKSNIAIISLHIYVYSTAAREFHQYSIEIIQKLVSSRDDLARELYHEYMDLYFQGADGLE
jgi:hypothetical protein